MFVDLAGAEFLASSTGSALEQTPQEKQEGGQTKSDLLRLKK